MTRAMIVADICTREGCQGKYDSNKPIKLSDGKLHVKMIGFGSILSCEKVVQNSSE